MKFIHKDTRLIVDLPDHFVGAEIAVNYTPLSDDFDEETDKVVISHAPNSLQRTGRKLREDKEDTVAETTEVQD